MIARLVRVVLLVACVGSGATCGPSDDSGDTGVRVEPHLAEISLPELSRVDAPVQAQIRDRYASVMKMIASGAGGRELGTAFGEYGMLLHAAEYLDAAKPAYLNAQALIPDDPR